MLIIFKVFIKFIFTFKEVKCEDEEIQSMIDVTVKHLCACIQPLKLTPAT
jgi:hypothetical protein